MSLFISIFGGMLLTAVLYGLARLARLTNYWAAALAAGLPTLAYMGYALVTRPSLDVVTIHVIAYPTIAVLLFQLYARKGQGTQGMHWIPRLLVLFFLGLSVIYGGFVYISSQGLPPSLAGLLLPNAEGKRVHTGFAGVVGHHEDAAKGIGQHLKQEATLSRLGWRVDVVGLNELLAGQAAEVAVYIRDAQGQGVDGVQASLGYGRPGQPEGEYRPMAGAGQSGYRGTLPALQAGTWVAHIRLASGDERVQLEKTLAVR